MKIVNVSNNATKKDFEGQQGKIIRDDRDAWPYTIEGIDDFTFGVSEVELQIPTLELGDRVELKGLKSKPELNGKPGILKAWDDEGKRWSVKLEHTGSLVSVKLANLSFLEKRQDRTPSPERPAPACNDELDHTMFSQQLACWSCRGTMRLASGELCPTCVGTGRAPTLAVGERVQLRGLRSKPELNGQTGNIMGWDNNALRWSVQLDFRAGFMNARTQNLKRELKAASKQEADRYEPASDAPLDPPGSKRPRHGEDSSGGGRSGDKASYTWL